MLALNNLHTTWRLFRIFKVYFDRRPCKADNTSSRPFTVVKRSWEWLVAEQVTGWHSPGQRFSKALGEYFWNQANKPENGSRCTGHCGAIFYPVFSFQWRVLSGINGSCGETNPFMYVFRSQGYMKGMRILLRSITKHQPTIFRWDIPSVFSTTNEIYKFVV